MTESEFIDMLDCNFPYTDIDAANEHISQAGEYSQNTLYFVLHEILRAPPGVTPATKQLLFNMWLAEYESDPLYRLVRRCVPAYLKNELVPNTIVVQLIEKLAPSKHQTYALSLLYFACIDHDKQAENAFKIVLDEWAMAYTKVQ